MEKINTDMTKPASKIGGAGFNANSSEALALKKKNNKIKKTLNFIANLVGSAHSR
jgi:hypothetical protein